MSEEKNSQTAEGIDNPMEDKSSTNKKRSFYLSIFSTTWDFFPGHNNKGILETTLSYKRSNLLEKLLVLLVEL